MQTANVALTQPISRPQKWEVVVGKERFILNEKQVAELKKRDQEGMRGMIWFDKFAISIPHIQSVHFEGYQEIPGEREEILSADEQYPDSLKDQEMRDKIAEMKNRFRGVK